MSTPALTNNWVHWKPKALNPLILHWVCRGRYHAVNVPLKEGMTDEAYEKLFKPVMRKVMEIYQPEAIVFQSGESTLKCVFQKHCDTASAEVLPCILFATWLLCWCRRRLIGG